MYLLQESSLLTFNSLDHINEVASFIEMVFARNASEASINLSDKSSHKNYALKSEKQCF